MGSQREEGWTVTFEYISHLPFSPRLLDRHVFAENVWPLASDQSLHGLFFKSLGNNIFTHHLAQTIQLSAFQLFT